MTISVIHTRAHLEMFAEDNLGKNGGTIRRSASGKRVTKSKLFIGLLCLSVCISGCGTIGYTPKNNVINITDDSFEIPDIVFMNVIEYLENPQSDCPQRAITFYDKNGNHYISTDEYVCTLYFEQLVEEFAEGKLSDRITYHSGCDRDKLLENYSKLCELSKDDFHIMKPEEGPDVLANMESWYGLYYDSEGQIQLLKIHEKDAHGDHDADDYRANEIYLWYMNSFD